MSETTVGLLAADQAAAVAELLVRANEEHLATFPPEVAAGYRRELADVAARTSSAEVYVAHVAERLAATVTFLPDADDDAHPWPPGGSVLRFLAVDPQARRQQLGGRLTQLCIERARSRGSRFLGLHTAPAMAAARRLYEGQGFERVPELDFDPGRHYGDGTPADEPPWGLAYVLRLEVR